MKRSISMAATASAVLLASSLVCGAVQAATVIFSDDFNNNSLAVPGTPAGWTIIPSNGGSVDRIGKDLANNTSYDFLPGNGIYIDMVGTATTSVPNSVGAIYTTSTFDLAPGTYTLSYLLAASAATATTRSRSSLGILTADPMPCSKRARLGLLRRSSFFQRPSLCRRR